MCLSMFYGPFGCARLAIFALTKQGSISAGPRIDVARSKIEREMVRRDLHPFHQIKAMGAETLHTGIELEPFAAVFARLCHQPVEQDATKASRAIALARDEIIDIHEFSREQAFREPITSRRANFRICFHVSEKITLRLLAQHALHEFLARGDMRA